MKIFLSWSKQSSHDYARAYREWIPKLIQEVQPFISSSDIALGINGIGDIEERLSSYSLGILFVTQENYSEPWLMYEAGALTRSVGDAERRVIPILIDVSREQLSGSPISVFQNVVSFEKESILSVCENINQALSRPLEGEVLAESFGVWWPNLDNRVKEIVPSAPEKIKKKSTIDDVLERLEYIIRELSELKRNERKQTNTLREISNDELMRRLVRSVDDDINSTNYIKSILHTRNNRAKFDDGFYSRLIETLSRKISDDLEGGEGDE